LIGCLDRIPPHPFLEERAAEETGLDVRFSNLNNKNTKNESNK
jgi:hypothetical protein